MRIQRPKVAIENAEEEGGGGGGGSSRLQVFLTSLFSSIGGVFSGIVQDQDSDMATTRTTLVVPHQQLNRGSFSFPDFFNWGSVNSSHILLPSMVFFFLIVYVPFWGSLSGFSLFLSILYKFKFVGFLWVTLLLSFLIFRVCVF